MSKGLSNFFGKGFDSLFLLLKLIIIFFAFDLKNSAGRNTTGAFHPFPRTSYCAQDIGRSATVQPALCP